MICHRSEKHSTGCPVEAEFSDIKDGIIFLPGNTEYTCFSQDNKRLCLRTYKNQSFVEFFAPFISKHTISPPGTVFTIIQDSLT